MGILDRLGVGKRTTDLLGYTSILSPYADESSLAKLVVADLMGKEFPTDLPMDRTAAMQVPAVSKGRNLLVSTISKFPLVALNKTGPITTQPSFLYRTDTNVTPYERMAWTIDDAIFYGYSLWRVRRGAVQKDMSRGAILSADYVPMASWTITDGNILIDEQKVPEDELLFFNSPFEGLLTVAQSTLRGARDTEGAWVGRARNPIPLVELHQTDDSLSDAQVKKFVDAWSAARRSENGGIGYTPEGIELRVHGSVSADLMVEGRNAIRTDVGSFLNIRASMLDGTAGVDSLTYSTTEGERNSFYEFDLPFWTDFIEARLSMDDVVPRGQRVRFDKYELYAATPTPTGRPTED